MDAFKAKFLGKKREKSKRKNSRVSKVKPESSRSSQLVEPTESIHEIKRPQNVVLLGGELLEFFRVKSGKK